MENYKGSFIYTKYEKKNPDGMKWKAFSGNEQSYSDTEEDAILKLKEKLDIMDNIKNNPML